MKKTIALSLIFLLLCATGLLSGCFYEYSTIDIVVESWQSTAQNPISFSFGEHFIARDYQSDHKNSFVAWNDRDFAREILKTFKPVRVDVSGERIIHSYLFFENNCYYCMQVSDYGSRDHYYFYSPSCSVYLNYLTENSVGLYNFPFFDSDHQDTFLYEQNSTKKSWAYFEDFYMRLSDDICKVDTSAKTILLKAKYQYNYSVDKYLIDDYVLKITYTAVADGTNALVLSLL